MFSNAKVGDRVWSYHHNWGTITKIERFDNYPLFVKFDNKEYVESFNLNGMGNVLDKKPTLFWDELKFEIPKKPFDLKAEFDKLEVSEFVPGECNLTVSYCEKRRKWNFYNFWVDFSIFPFIYFKDVERLRDFCNLLNEHKITPEELRTLMLEKLREVYGE